MQIPGLTSSGSVRLGDVHAPSRTETTSDTFAMNMSPETFSNLVKQAMEMPDVRQNLVDAYKARVSSGHYPDAVTLDGLTRVMSEICARQAAEPNL